MFTYVLMLCVIAKANHCSISVVSTSRIACVCAAGHLLTTDALWMLRLMAQCSSLQWDGSSLNIGPSDEKTSDACLLKEQWPAQCSRNRIGNYRILIYLLAELCMYTAGNWVVEVLCTQPWTQAFRSGFCLTVFGETPIFSKGARQNPEWKAWAWGYYAP